MFHVEHTFVSEELAAVPRETHQRLQVLVDVVQRWNPTINLVAEGDTSHMWSRHILDSLQLMKFLPERCGTAADLGSGAGFPGLVLAIASGVPFHLIEADRRKAAFLMHAAHLTEAPVTVHAQRIEDWGLRNMDLVTSRALAPLDRLLGYAWPILAPDGLCLFLKGAAVSLELSEAQAHWKMRVTRVASRSQVGGELLCIDKISRA